MRLKRLGAYAGVDPTASSLHLGHLLVFMPLFWMYYHGYAAMILIGGSTAKIGDPTGRTTSRPELDKKASIQNLANIHYQCKQLWQNVNDHCRRFGYQQEWAWKRGIVNNNAWWNKQSLLEILRIVGSELRLGPLLGRDNVKKRLDDKSGMSFSEFCYPIMQAWDWCQLFKQMRIQMQIGGSDQYGNILTGSECVKSFVKNSQSSSGQELPNGPQDIPIGFTVPLLTDSSGAKFGKSAGNAIWLDPTQTSPFDLYGYLVRRPDDEVERLLKLFTFLPQSQIATVMEEHNKDPSKRVAQHLLAYEVSWLVHGHQTAANAQGDHRSMYGTQDADASVLAPAKSGDEYQPPHEGNTTAVNRPRIDMKLPQHLLETTLSSIVCAAKLGSSKSDAQRQINAGGIYLGGRPGQGSQQTGMIISQLSFMPAKSWSKEIVDRFLIDGSMLILRKGKHNLRVIEFISDEEWVKSGAEYDGQPYTGAFRKAVSAMNKVVRAAQKPSPDTKGASDGEATHVREEEPQEVTEDEKPDLDKTIRELDVPMKLKHSMQIRKIINVRKAAGVAKKGPWDRDD